MAKTEKVERVAELKERIAESRAILLTEYRGLTVADATELRRSLGESGTRLAVVKNTLMKRAADEAGIEQLASLLEGPTAVAFVIGDPVGAAKKVVDAARRFPALVLKGAYLEGRVLSAEDAQALATLESREAMLSKIAGLMKSEMSRAAYAFQALQSRFLAMLEAYKEKLPPDDAPAAEAVAADKAAQLVTEGAAEDVADAATTSETASTDEDAVVASDTSEEAPSRAEGSTEATESTEAETSDEEGKE